jgi:large subunit ribosomal protein L4
MKIDILNKEGKSTGKQIELNDAIYGIEPNEHAIYLNVKQYLANQRQGTHSTLTRSFVSGSTKKLHKQKGTGGSRKGSVKNIQYPGGPRAFGPLPRDYRFKLNKKVKDLAKKSIFSAKAKSNNICVVEDFDFDTIKTTNYIQFLSNMKLSGQKTLLVTGEAKKNIIFSARNIKGANTVAAENMNAYDMINSDTIILSVDAIKKIEENLN